MDPRIGGPCMGIRYSIPAMTQLGVQNEVVSYDEPNAAYLANDPFTVHALGGKKWPGAYNGFLYSWLLRNLHKYDVVIVHGIWLYHSFAVYRAFRKLKSKKSEFSTKLLIMPHGMLDPWFQRATTRRLKALRNEIYWRVFEKNVINSADAILFTCEQELELARKTFQGYQPKKEINVGYGIKEPPTFADHFSAPIDTDYILYLSRIHPKKGVDLLIVSYIELVNDGIKLPDLVIAGPINSAYGKEMIKLAQACPRIHFTGILLAEKKWGALYNAKAFILPSHQENFGISVVEALACGKPILITDQVNIWSDIFNKNDFSGSPGFVQKDNLVGVKNLLKSFSNLSSTDLEFMGMQANRVFKDKFSVNSVVKNTIQKIKELD